jgi:hypothetical protein
VEAWQTILLAFGGNAALLAVLGLLGKSIIEKVLARDTQRLEYELKSKADTELEKLRSTLATTATEHQIRFAKLHEKRAEVIAETYSRLRELHTNLGDYVKIFEPAGDRPKEERRQRVGDAHRSFIEYYSKNRIFLSKAAVEKLDDINQKSVSAFYDFFYSVEMVQAAKGDSVKKWMEIFEHVKDEMPVALSELEDEFRKLLGDES